jgi:hypothetical protein
MAETEAAERKDRSQATIYLKFVDIKFVEKIFRVL